MRLIVELDKLFVDRKLVVEEVESRLRDIAERVTVTREIEY